MSHVPKLISDDAFYLRALPKANGQIWYYNKAAGRETLRNVVNNINERGKVPRALYNDDGIPEQVIQETTGHRSSVISWGLRHINVLRRRLKEKRM